MANTVSVEKVGNEIFFKTAPVFQYNEGNQYLELIGFDLPSSYRVDFSNYIDSQQSISMIGGTAGVVIPSELLATGSTVYAFYVDVDSDATTTLYRIEIPVVRRPEPSDREPSPEEQSAISQLMNDVGDLKSDLDDITENVTSKNIFNADTTNRTEGKYINPSNGNYGSNASYAVVEDYIKCEPNTSYYGSWWATNGNLVGQLVGLYGFYDGSKQFISGFQTTASNGGFTTPAGCQYLKLSAFINNLNSYRPMIEKGTTYTIPYVPYFAPSKKIKRPVLYVDINGDGDYTSIQEAVTKSPNGATIYVMPGTYEENVEAWNKEIHIIGIDKNKCILKDTSGNYSTPPLEMDSGSLENMSIIEMAESADVTTENMAAYGIHIEGNSLFNNTLLIRNCYIYSNVSAAIGMGLRGGSTVRIEDCELVVGAVEGTTKTNWGAPLYFHDANASAYFGESNVYLWNCLIRNESNRPGMMMINSIHAENSTYMHFIQNVMVQESSGKKWNTWNSSGNDGADGWNGLSKMYLTKDSFGNNQTELNYA